MLLIGLSIYTALFKRDVLGQLRGDVIAALTYVSNWYQIWVGQGYTATGDFAPLRHLWSLAVEEQFYLVWPLVMIALMRLGRRRLPELAPWLFLAALGITVLTAVLVPQGAISTCEVTPEAYWKVGERCISKLDFVYLGTFTRASGVLLGGAFAMVWRPVAIMRSPLAQQGPPRRRRRPRRAGRAWRPCAGTSTSSRPRAPIRGCSAADSSSPASPRWR